jgi:DNA-binding LacI/PurR family transcriptional regulator
MNETRSPTASKDSSEQSRRSAPTMRDIAREANVSRSTVSRVLSGAPTGFPVAERTRERIHKAARDMGYRPNPLARGLRGAPTMLLGLIVRDIIDPLDAAAIQAASVEAGKHDYNVVLGHVRGRADEGVELWRILESRHCDAIIFLGDLLERPDFAAELRDTNIPVVAVWHWTRSSTIPTVNVDNRAGITAALDHLAALGHQRIAFVSDRHIGEAKQRESAYRAYVSGSGIGLQPDYIQGTSEDTQSAVHALDRLMSLDEPPTAIVCSTDATAISVLQAAQLRGLRVPQDISIVGFDDILVATASLPALTTVRQPVPEMIEAAVAILFQSLEGGGVPPDQQHPVIEPSLVVRGSTGPAPSSRSRE